MMIDSKFTIRNENRELNDDAHSGYVTFFPASFYDAFVINASTLYH